MIYLHWIQLLGFLGAQVNNTVLLVLIWVRADRLFGNYKYVMALFSLYSLVYAWIEVITFPVMHSKVPMFIIFNDGRFKYYEWFGHILTCIYCGSFALCISLLAVQFYYRYIVVCKPFLIHRIEGFRSLVLLIPPSLCYAAWHCIVMYGMSNTEEKQQHVADELKLYYDEDASKVTFIALMFWKTGQNGEKIWQIDSLLAVVGCDLILIVCFTAILTCGVKIYSELRRAGGYMSVRARDINRQIFMTLTLQTVLPFLMMYCPVGLVITAPMFGIELGKFANIDGLSVGVYPSLEPLIALFVIKDFRRTLLGQKDPKISVHTEITLEHYNAHRHTTTN